MSWHFSRALVAAYSAASCSDGGPSALSSLTPTLGPSLPSGKTTAASLLSRSGTTSGPLMDGLGQELLTWFRGASRVRTSPLREKVPASAEREADSGARCGASWARYDPATSSWKTRQRSLLGDWEPCSETWPRWGMMLAGECWELSTPVRRIAGTASGLWQTPVADDAVARSAGKWNSRGEPKLSAQVMFSTPCAMDAKPITGGNLYRTKTGTIRHMRPDGKSSNRGLCSQVIFPTPTSQDSKNCTLPPSQRDRDSIPGMMLRTGATPGGQLNPSWVEWLMGWPIGWTDCAQSATDRFRQWRHSHGVCCP